MEKRLWQYNEIVLVLYLYYQIPFGAIRASNPEIISLSKLLHRTPDAVAFKLANLASIDPFILNSGRRGLKNGSKLDKVVFDTYSHDLIQLAIDAQLIEENLSAESSLYSSNNYSTSIGKDIQANVKTRIGQQFFSKSVKAQYNNKCCITEIEYADILEAAHIKPWKDCNETEKVELDNGLCLNSFHHKLFDSGLISFDKEYRLVISRKVEYMKMDEITKTWIMSYKTKQINLPDRNQPRIDFIEYHNRIFNDNLGI